LSISCKRASPKADKFNGKKKGNTYAGTQLPNAEHGDQKKALPAVALATGLVIAFGCFKYKS
jgi:hypothetical protein